MDDQNNINPVGDSGNTNPVGDNNVSPTMDNSNYSNNVSSTNSTNNSTNNTVYEATPINNNTNSNMGGAPKESPHALNIISLIFGILSLLCCCSIIIGGISAITAIITGIFGRKYPGKGLGTAGIVCGVIALIFVILLKAIKIYVASVALSAVPGILDKASSIIDSGSGTATNIDSESIQKIVEEISNFEGMDSVKKILNDLLQGGLTSGM